jgi:hypothetical protein
MNFVIANQCTSRQAETKLLNIFTLEILIVKLAEVYNYLQMCTILYMPTSFRIISRGTVI